MNKNQKFRVISLGIICLFYILFRLWHLTDSCLWFDEIFSIHAAEQSWSSLFWFVAQDLIHPPLFYVLLKIWITIGGETLFWLRFFPVFFSILTLVPFYFLCRQLKLNFQTIAVAFAFLAANGALIKYAQEVRMYALFLFLSVVSIWLFTRFLHLGKNIWLLSLTNIFLIYTHYFGWLIVLAEVFVILILQRIKIRQISIMLGICFLSFAPWIVALWRTAQINADLAQNIGWISKPGLITIFQFVFDLIEPFYYQASSADFASFYQISIPILLIIGAAKIFYLINYKSFAETEKRDFLMLSVFVGLPILIALIVSWILPYSVWGTRHLIIVFVPTAILIGAFIDAIGPQILKIIAISALFLLFTIAFIIELQRPKQEFIWCAWENLAQNIDTKMPQKIYVFEDLVAYHFWFALRQSENVQIIKIKNLEGVKEDAAYFLPRGFDAVQTTNDFAGERFWIAFRDARFVETNPILQNLKNKGYTIGEPETFEAQGIKAFLVEVHK